jgi:hypothetical protein
MVDPGGGETGGGGPLDVGGGDWFGDSGASTAVDVRSKRGAAEAVPTGGDDADAAEARLGLLVWRGM